MKTVRLKLGWEKISICCFDRLKETYERRMYVTHELQNFLVGASLHFTSGQ